MKRRVSFRLTMTLLLAAVLFLPSCRKAAEKARENIRVEAVSKFEAHGLAGADLTLRVKNDTRHKLVLRRASMTLWYMGARIGDVSLREEVQVAPRTTGDVLTRWKFKIDDPIALFVVARRVAQHDLSQIGVSYEADGRGGPMPVNISQPQIPLSDFLRIFGLKADDLQKYLGE